MDLRRIRPTWVEVDLDAVAHNTAELRRLTNPAAKMMAVVKADGYGHGAVKVAETALNNGAEWLAVAVLEEAVALRQAGVTAPILVLGYLQPGQADTAAVYDLRLTVYDMETARALDQWGRALGRKVKIHVKVDTGMGRIGLQPEDVVPYLQAVGELRGLDVEGLYTHFATADEAERSFTQKQFAIFKRVLEQVEGAGITLPVRHAANSAALMVYPDTHLDMVRAGVALYGLRPSGAVDWPADLRPAMTWKTRISHLKTVPDGTPISYGRTYHTSGEERIATLPVGYADGYPRRLSNDGQILVAGTICPLVGQVCMDQIMIHIPASSPAEVGDEVVLMGRQGAAEISADDLASQLGTISYEIVCGVGKRVPRIYRQGDQIST